MGILNDYFYYSAKYLRRTGFSDPPNIYMGIFGVSMVLWINTMIFIDSIYPGIFDIGVKFMFLAIILPALYLFYRYKDRGKRILLEQSHKNRKYRYLFYAIESVAYLAILPIAVRMIMLHLIDIL